MSGRHAVVTLYPVYSPDTLPFRSLTFASDSDNICIGRSSKCLSKNLVPAHNNGWFESRVMSREHARIGVCLEKEAIYIRDNGSMHGTSVNDKKIHTGKEVTIRSGDILTFGNEVTRGSETFAPLKVRCECQWFDNDDKEASEASEPPEVLPSKPPTNSFAVPDDDDVIEISRSSGYKQVTTFTVPDSDDDSESDSVPPQEQPTPATSPLSKDPTTDSMGEDTETSIQKPPQFKPAADTSDEGSRRMPVVVDEDQALVTPTTTPPPAADSPCSFMPEDADWDSEDIDSAEDDSASQWSQELEDEEEDADASSSSGESSEEGFADNVPEAPNKSFTPPPPNYPGVSFMPCIDEWAGPSTTHHTAQLPLGSFPPSNPYPCYSDGPFMISHARSSAGNIGPADSITLPGPDSLVGRHDNRFMDEQRWKGLPGCNNFGRPVLPPFMHLPLLSQPTNQNGNVINDERTIGQENGIERRAAESTATTRVSIADIVHECKPETESRTSLKRKAAEMELESIDSVPSYFDEFSDLPQCGESMREAQLESVFSDVASLPDAQPQLPVNDLDSASSELTKIRTVCHVEQSKKNDVPEEGPLRKRAKLTHVCSRRNNFARDAILALGGVVVGSILTVAGLASLPPDFFSA